MTSAYRRSSGPAALLAAVAVALAACAGSGSPALTGSPTVASLPTSTGTASTGAASGHSSTATTLPPGNNPTALVDEWASCMRDHGDPNQSDPIIDSHGVINITSPPLRKGGPPGKGAPPGNPHGATGTCSQYLVKAQVALRAEFPVADPQGPSQTTYLKYVDCMRANGVPNYPFPSGPNDRETNFIGTGVDPNSPQVERVNTFCGKKLGLPAWWINGWGPPGDISVGLPAGGPPPAPAFEPAGNNGGSAAG